MLLRRSLSLLAVVLTAASTVAVAPAPAVAAGDYQQVLDVTFPTRPDASFGDTYDACRDGCARQHKAADIMGGKMWPEYAMVDGVVCRIDEGEEDSYGRHLTLCGDDGRRYRYLHLNNDTPGTDDGKAALEHVYAPGIREGLRVARGQLLAYMGDSGNAEGTPAHLHLDIFDDDVVDPYGDNRINPYPSLMAALSRGDVADGSVVHSDPVSRVAGADRIATAIELSRARPVDSRTVVLARADDPTDALVAGPLAGVLEAPVLITPPDTLDGRVLDEIRRRKATHAVVVGVAPSAKVVGALQGAGLTVERLRGEDRFSTADAVAQAVWEATGAGGGVDVPEGQGHVEGDAPATGTAASLVVHRDEARRGTVALDGATVAGDVAVELVVSEPWLVERVVFRLDGTVVGEERQAPYDLLGSRGWDRPQLLDTRQLANGTHTVAVTIERDGAEDLQLTAEVTVANGSARTALLALGEHEIPSRQWPDAMVGSYLGAATGQPVLLTSPDRLPATTAALLDGVDVTVIGGEVAIPRAVVSGLDVTRRLAGSDRYATAVAVTDGLQRAGRVDAERVWAATGTNWPDAITAGPVVAALGDTLVLIDGGGHGFATATSAWMHRLAGASQTGRVIGGPDAVLDQAVTGFALDLT